MSTQFADIRSAAVHVRLAGTVRTEKDLRDHEGG